MFYVTLPICCGIHIANNYRREPNATLNRITSFAIPLLAAAGLGFVAGRYPGNFFEGFSFTFIPYPIARALFALKAICIQHAHSLVAFLASRSSDVFNSIFGCVYAIYMALLLHAPHFVAAPAIAALAYVVFGLINVASDYSGDLLGRIICIILFNSFFIITYCFRLRSEYIINHR